MDLVTKEWGAGEEKIVCVHGSLSAGEAAFSEQAALGNNYRVVVPYRRGYGDNPPIQRVNVSADADDVVALVGGGAHLLGTSMGGIVSMIAAGRIPEKIRSLTIVEPPAFPLAVDIPEVRQVSDQLQAFYDKPPTKQEAFCSGFLQALGLDMQLPTPYPPPLARAVSNLMTEYPWRQDVPVGAVADAPFPKLVVSGNWSPAFESIADRLAALLSARREVFDGASHGVQKIGDPFNQLLREFLGGTNSVATRSGH